MFKSRITEKLGVKYPIIGGTMMWISDADFVAAISNAGGLGILASAIYHSREEFAAAIDRIRELVASGRIGSVAESHLSFMGSITSPGRLVRDTAPQAAQHLVDQRVDIALLVPV